MGHSCDACSLRCMDFRIAPEEFQRLAAKVGYGQNTYDQLSVAGAGKVLLSTVPGKADLLFENIEIAIRLHGVSEVAVFMHDNCGYYAISDAALEDQTQRADCLALKELLPGRYAGIKVRTFIIKGTATGQFDIVEVM